MRKRRKTRVQVMAQERAEYVVCESTRQAIEKIAEDFAREALADPEFRAELRRDAREAARKVVEAMRAARGEPRTSRNA